MRRATSEPRMPFMEGEKNPILQEPWKFEAPVLTASYRQNKLI